MGDGIDTDLLAPGAYMSGSLDTLSSHCLEALRPDFANAVRPGDIILAGASFGIGSSREQAAEALKHLGIRAIIARSLGGIFQRNALNLGCLQSPVRRWIWMVSTNSPAPMLISQLAT